MPDVEFPLFRAAARRLLDPAAFAYVDAIYLDTYARAGACAGLLRGRGTAARAGDRAAAVLQQLTIDATSAGEVLTRMRAAQAGLFAEGLFLDPSVHAELFQPPARGAQRRRALPPSGPPGDETVLEAALATVTTPSGQPGTPIALAALADALSWSLERLDTALAALTEHLADTGIRIDADPGPAGTPVRGLRARDRHLSDGQRAALHQLRHPTTPLDAGAARVLYAVAHPPGTLTEGDAPDPASVVALQQRGIIRRRARAGYLELTDDARFSLAPEPPDPDGPLSL